MKIRTVAIVGFGRFGQFLAETLLTHTTLDILVVSRRPLSVENTRIQQIELTELGRAEIVFPTVAISAFADVIEAICPHLHHQALVIDMCSVKEHPVEVMRASLPTTVQIIACHPMFGPDSVRKNHGVAGLPIMLWPERCEKTRFAQIKEFCQRLQLNIVEISPTKHDEYAAYSQAYAFLIGKIGEEMQLSTSPLDTWWYSVLREQAEAVANDDPQLFLDIERYNRFAGLMRQRFTEVSSRVLHQIGDEAH